MSSFTKSLVVLTLALSACALSTPHVQRNAHQHRALAARVAVPEPAAVPIAAIDEPIVVRPRKRGLTKRCKPQSSSVIPASFTSASQSSSASHSSSPSAAPTVPVGNPESKPPVSILPSTTEAPAPPPTTKAAPPTTEVPTTTAKPAPSKTSPAAPLPSGPSFLNGPQSGDGTFYAIGLGACGITNSGTDRIAAVSELLFDSFPGYDGTNPNTNPVCNRGVTATYQGKTTHVTITDRCTACGQTSLDFSPTAFSDLADFAVGRIHGVVWTWDE